MALSVSNIIDDKAIPLTEKEQLVYNVINSGRSRVSNMLTVEDMATKRSDFEVSTLAYTELSKRNSIFSGSELPSLFNNSPVVTPRASAAQTSSLRRSKSKSPTNSGPEYYRKKLYRWKSSITGMRKKSTHRNAISFHTESKKLLNGKLPFLN